MYQRLYTITAYNMMLNSKETNKHAEINSMNQWMLFSVDEGKPLWFSYNVLTISIILTHLSWTQERYLKYTSCFVHMLKGLCVLQLGIKSPSSPVNRCWSQRLELFWDTQLSVFLTTLFLWAPENVLHAIFIFPQNPFSWKLNLTPWLQPSILL